MSSFKNKQEIKEVIRKYKTTPEHRHRPLTPVEPWVFDSVRDYAEKNKNEIEHLKILIRDPKGG